MIVILRLLISRNKTILKNDAIRNNNRKNFVLNSSNRAAPFASRIWCATALIQVSQKKTRAIISTGSSIFSSYIQLQFLKLLLRSFVHRCSVAGKKKDLLWRRNCLSSSNTLCESVDSSFFFMLFDIFFHYFLLLVRFLRLLFLF